VSGSTKGDLRRGETENVDEGLDEKSALKDVETTSEKHTDHLIQKKMRSIEG